MQPLEVVAKIVRRSFTAQLKLLLSDHIRFHLKFDDIETRIFPPNRKNICIMTVDVNEIEVIRPAMATATSRPSRDVTNRLQVT